MHETTKVKKLIEYNSGRTAFFILTIEDLLAELLLLDDVLVDDVEVDWEEPFGTDCFRTCDNNSMTSWFNGV